MSEFIPKGDPTPIPLPSFGDLLMRAVVSAIVIPFVAVVVGPVPAAITAAFLNGDGSGGAGGACA